MVLTLMNRMLLKDNCKRLRNKDAAGQKCLPISQYIHKKNCEDIMVSQEIMTHPLWID